MKVRKLRKLLLTGAFLTCSHTIFADAGAHNADVQKQLKELSADLDNLKIHLGVVEQKPSCFSENTSADDLSNVDGLSEEDQPEESGIVDSSEEDQPEEQPMVSNDSEGVELSKVHGLIKNYMQAQGFAARRTAMQVITDELQANPKNTCFEIVKYVQDGGTGKEEKFGTLFGLMGMDARYFTKGTRGILKGIKTGIEVREKDARGVYIKGKIKFTPEMLCKK
ncbi:MAG: hypothetical protein COY39_01550 [Alphaproteobacteria bacterium CG_4_10_14_0_8_um_filter_37_21]|nr:MAG: hypothetical protein COY39_01550 [Alphaproteobacteria bacterium CG_4_10_14_0_8_um_filter_37_21]